MLYLLFSMLEYKSSSKPVIFNIEAKNG